ncbi:MAG: peptidylprolyl isomerase [Bacteroidaceae bacterium]|nr:peptidylprolyl isomerase [Bacteroidaceae bacterium]
MRNFMRMICGIVMTLLMSGCSDKNDRIGKTEVVIETDRGKITLRLFDDTPVHRDNFIRLAKAGAYDGIIWHRVVKDMLIQSGDPRLKARGEKLMVDTSQMNYTLPAEIHYPRHYHRAGALAAARESNDVNPEKRSSGTQFYIVGGTVYTPGKLAEVHQLMQDADTLHKIPALTEAQKKSYTTKGGAAHLDGEYTVFGQVVDGLEVVKYLTRTPTDDKEHPLKEICIKRVIVKD